MRSPSWALVGLVLVAGSLPVVMSASRLRVTAGQVEGRQTSLRSTIGAAERVLELRAREQRVSEQKRPEQDVIARVGECLAAAGIPARHLGGVRPESDAVLPGTTGSGRMVYRRQAVRVSLTGLTVVELGQFLSRWAATQQLWTPTRIELTHVAQASDPARYDVALVIAATYIAEAPLE